MNYIYIYIYLFDIKKKKNNASKCIFGIAKRSFHKNTWILKKI